MSCGHSSSSLPPQMMVTSMHALSNEQVRMPLVLEKNQV